MQTALDLATALFIFTFLAGLVLMGVTIFNVSHYHRPLRRPSPPRLPTRPLDQANQALERLKSAYYRAVGMGRNRLGHEVRRLELRIQQIQSQTSQNQYHYYHLARKQEALWSEWRELHDQMGGLTRQEKKDNLRLMAEAEKKYHQLETELQDEWHRAVALDTMLYDELNAQNIFASETSLLTQAEMAEVVQAMNQPEEAAALTPEDEQTLSHTQSAPPEAEPGQKPQDAPSPQPAPPPRQNMPSAGRATLSMPSVEAAPSLPQENGFLPDGYQDEDEDLYGGEPPTTEFQLKTHGHLQKIDFSIPGYPKHGLKYTDPGFSLDTISGGLLEGEDLSFCDFRGVRFEGLHLHHGVNFSGSDLRQIILDPQSQPHHFSNCDFSGACLEEAHLELVHFEECNLENSRWEGAFLKEVTFTNCNLDGVIWHHCDLAEATFIPPLEEQPATEGQPTLEAQPPEQPPGGSQKSAAPTPPAPPKAEK